MFKEQFILRVRKQREKKKFRVRELIREIFAEPWTDRIIQFKKKGLKLIKAKRN